jgi:hypothetical protein
VGEDRERGVLVAASTRTTPLYHLMLDSTAIPLDACVELIATAAQALRRAAPAAPAS